MVNNLQPTFIAKPFAILVKSFSMHFYRKTTPIFNSIVKSFTMQNNSKIIYTALT